MLNNKNSSHLSVPGGGEDVRAQDGRLAPGSLREAFRERRSSESFGGLLPPRGQLALRLIRTWASSLSMQVSPLNPRSSPSEGREQNPVNGGPPRQSRVSHVWLDAGLVSTDKAGALLKGLKGALDLPSEQTVS